MKVKSNNTGLTIDEVLALPLLTTFRNEWRRRYVSIFGLNETEVVTLGRSFDDDSVVVCKESREDYQSILQSIITVD